MEASRTGMVTTVKRYICKSEINLQDPRGDTPLTVAAHAGHTPVIRCLIDAKASLETANNGGWTPLMLGAKAGHLSVVTCILDACRSRCCIVLGTVNTKKTRSQLQRPPAPPPSPAHPELLKTVLEARNQQGDSALTWASWNGHISIVKRLVQAKANVEAANVEGQTALVLAAMAGHIAIMRYLAEYGNANVDAKDDGGDTALTWAATEGRLEVVQYLLRPRGEKCRRGSERIDANDENLSRGNHQVSDGKATDVDISGNVERKDLHGKTLLIMSAEKGHVEVVKHLIENGKANIDAKTNKGDTALTWAFFNGHLEVGTYLIESKANVEARNPSGKTALMLAARKGYMDCVSYLVENAQANVQMTCDKGKTALDLARKSGNEHVVAYLADAVKDREQATLNCISRDLMGLAMLHRSILGAMTAT